MNKVTTLNQFIIEQQAGVPQATGGFSCLLHHEVFSDKLRFIFIELPAFTNEEEECITDFERWIYVLKNMETLNRLPFKARKAVFEKLEKIIDSHH